MKKKLLFVFNPFSGKGQVKDNLFDIIDIFTKGGYDVTAYPTQAAMDGYEKVRAEAKEYDMIVASGGDGTLSEVVKALMEQDKKIPLGYIPAGSTNDFAASIGISRKMTEAANEIMNGVRFEYDVGEFNGQYYVYVAGFGAFTDVSYETSQNIKNKLGHMAYILEGIKRLPKISGQKMVVEHDGERIEGSFILGLVSNTISVGGMRKLISNGVCFDDGLFEITLVKTPSNPIALQKTINDVLFKKLTDEKCFVTFKTSRVKFTCENEIPWTLDGESGGIHKEVEIINHKQALRLIIAPDDKTEEQQLVNAIDENA
ncbi:MAG: YegS/Rv2252/BmrU family lipid kinase [Ruminococcus sp.]|nr:YegS/Rv2252/BmrU family lipid kinase [Ruminococcus sp.]